MVAEWIKKNDFTVSTIGKCWNACKVVKWWFWRAQKRVNSRTAIIQSPYMHARPTEDLFAYKNRNAGFPTYRLFKANKVMILFWIEKKKPIWYEMVLLQCQIKAPRLIPSTYSNKYIYRFEPDQDLFQATRERALTPNASHTWIKKD